MNKILIILDYREYLRQGMDFNSSIDIKKVKKVLVDNGYDVTIVKYDDLVNKMDLTEIKDYNIIYCSSQREIYKSYIDDILYSLSKKNRLVPSYDIFKAHENKAYQEIYKLECGIKSLKAYSFANYVEFLQYKEQITYPAVLKSLTGAGSLGVYKVNSAEDTLKLIKKINKKEATLNNIKSDILFNTKELLVKTVYKNKKNVTFFENYRKEDPYFGRYIIQQFVPNLESDYKVLVFGDKYYVLNRKVRENDFRASGSGKLEFIEAPTEVLDFAKECYEKLDVPFVSLDICIDENNKCYLIEYQGTHFGPYTLIYSEYYYVFARKWNKIKCKSDLAEEYATSVVNYIKKV